MSSLRILMFSTFIILLLGGCQSNGRGGLGVGIVFQDNHHHTQSSPGNGPPAHAPAHGRRHKQKYTYRYYPGAEIYFSPASGLYFYYSDSEWRSTVKLSGELKADLGSSYVTLDMDTDKPYKHHKEHVEKYPPGQAKKKHKQGKGRGNGNNKWK